LIEKRLGLETFLDKMGGVSRHELYSKAAKHPQLRPKQPSELLLDHEFCRLFKALEGMSNWILNGIRSVYNTVKKR